MSRKLCVNDLLSTREHASVHVRSGRFIWVPGSGSRRRRHGGIHFRRLRMRSSNRRREMMKELKSRNLRLYLTRTRLDRELFASPEVRLQPLYPAETAASFEARSLLAPGLRRDLRRQVRRSRRATSACSSGSVCPQAAEGTEGNRCAALRRGAAPPSHRTPS